MFRHAHARRAVLLLIVLAFAVAWTANQTIGAAANDRADKSATPAGAADKAVTGTTAKEPPPATAARADTTAKDAGKAAAETTVTEPAPATAAAPQGGQAKGQLTRDEVFPKKFQKVAPSEQKAAATRAAKSGMKPGVAGRTDITAAAVTPADLLPGEGPGGVPHYFGPFGNFAFSPLPKGSLLTADH